jgi:hypothetical protein
MDRHGRVFFIDHKNRTTTWQKPEIVTHHPVVNNGDTDEVNRRRGSAEAEDTSGNKSDRLFSILSITFDPFWPLRVQLYSDIKIKIFPLP